MKRYALITIIAVFIIFAGLFAYLSHKKTDKTTDNYKILTDTIIHNKEITTDSTLVVKKVGNIQLTQYTNNTLNNPYDTLLEIVGITTIPPKSSKTFEMGGQSSVMIKVGHISKTVEVKPNEKPKIGITRMTTMDEDTRATHLQSTVCYRVTISDDFPGQLDVNIRGLVTFKNAGNNVYDITMRAFRSYTEFNNFAYSHNSPYSIGFAVTVTDRIAGHKVTGHYSFTFGEW